MGDLIFSIIKYLVFLLLFQFCFPSEKKDIISINFSYLEDSLQILDEKFSEPFFLEKLNFSSDVRFDQDEFLYLLGFNEGQIITNNDLKNALFYFKHKNIFEQVNICICNGQSGKIISFEFIGFWIVSKIRIKGILFGKDKLLNYYMLYPGEPFGQVKHDNSLNKIKKHLDAQGYLNSKVTSDLIYNNEKFIEVCIKINTGNRFSIEKVNFDFIEIIEKGKSDLIDSLELDFLKKKIETNYKSRFTKFNYSISGINETTKLLKKYLSRNGFTKSNISLEEFIDYKECKVILNIKINLEKKINIEFLGNNLFSNSQLHDFIFSLGYISQNLPMTLVADEIIRLYKNKGYWDIEIQIKEEKNKYVFYIYEGKQIKIEKISFKGVNGISEKFLLDKYLKSFFKKKDFDSEVLDQILDDIINFYYSQSFLQAKIVAKNFILKSNSDKSYILEIIIEEGEKQDIKSTKIQDFQEVQNNHFKFGKFITKGANLIAFNKIYKEVEFHENEIWNKNCIDKTYDNFASLDTFESIYLYPLFDLDYKGFRPLIINLLPCSDYELRTRFGFQTINKNLYLLNGDIFKVGITFLRRNFFTFADNFLIDLDFNFSCQKFFSQYKFPNFLRLPIISFFQIYYNSHQRSIWKSEDNLYRISRIGSIFGIEKKYKNLTNFGINFAIEGIKISQLSEKLSNTINFSDNCKERYITYFFLEPNLVVDCLDNKLNPSKGFLTILSFKAAAPLSKEGDFFLKFVIEQLFFSSIFNPAILAFRFKFGHIFNSKFNTIIPSERFYLGGPSSLRSFEPDCAPPYGFFDDNFGKKKFVPQGGSTMLNMNFELKIPILQNLWLIFFQDIGSLYRFSDLFFNNEILTATGLGICYNTALGPVRLDLGFRPKMFAQDSIFSWFLTFGNSF